MAEESETPQGDTSAQGEPATSNEAQGVSPPSDNPTASHSPPVPAAPPTGVDEIMAGLASGMGESIIAAITAACAQREQLAPRLIAALREANAVEAYIDPETECLRGIHFVLLAELRARESLPLLEEMARVPDFQKFEFFEEFYLELAPAMIAELDDDPAATAQRLLLDDGIDPLVRGAFTAIYGQMYAARRATREEVVHRAGEVLRALVATNGHCELINDLASKLLHFQPLELADELRALAETSRVDFSVGRVNRSLRSKDQDVTDDLEQLYLPLSIDAIEELEIRGMLADEYLDDRAWYAEEAFGDEEFEDEEFEDEDFEGEEWERRFPGLVDEPEADHSWVYSEDTDPPPKDEPLRVPPRVGRNEPCPCGSGKKFKKCCGKHKP